MGGFMKQNAGAIGTGVGTAAGSLVGMPQLGGMAGGLAGSALAGGDVQNMAAAPGANPHDPQRAAQMQLLNALMQMMQQPQPQPMQSIMPMGPR